MTVDRIADTSALERLAPAWNELVAASDADGLFSTWEWLATWWRHLGAGRRLRVCAVRSRGELIAIAPLALRPARLDRHPAFACLELLGAGEVGSDYLDVIVRRGREAEAIPALVDALAGETHVLSLGRLRTDACSVAALATQLAGRGWDVVERPDERSPFIAVGGRSFDDYLQGLGSSHRYAFRRRLRGLERAFSIELLRVRTEAERGPALATLIELHARRWDGRGRDEAFASPLLVAFHDEVTRLALARGWLRLYVLRLDGRPAAALYGFRYRDVFHYYQAGFDPAFAPHSVGLVMLGLVVRDAIGEGVTEIDLG
ncbi:MAG: GNAT family N-acetyltransferase, partial [Acidobacteriota bacterium]